MAAGYLKTISLQLAAATTNGYAQTQSGTAGTALTLNGSLVTNGVGIADVGRRVAIHSNGNDSGITFAVTGTTNNGYSLTENVIGGNASTVATLTNFKTVTGIVPSGNTASTVYAGTNGVGSTDPAVVDYFANKGDLGLIVSGDGTTNYSIEYCNDDVWPNMDIYSTPPTWVSPAQFSATTDTPNAGRIPGPFTLWRLTINSGTGKITAKGAMSLVGGGA